MSKRKFVLRSAPVRGVFCLTLVASLVIGASSAGASPADREKPKWIKVIDKRPDPPVAGRAFTVTFVVLQGDERIEMKEFDCYARTKKIPLIRLREKQRDGLAAKCTWDIPEQARGEELEGILAAILARDERTFRGFGWPIE